MLENIKNIGISEITSDVEKLVIDEKKSKVFNKISLTFTAKEFDQLTTAINELTILGGSPSFSEFLRLRLKSDVAVTDFRKRCMDPIISSLDKIKPRTKQATKKSINTDNNFYTKSFPVTDAFIALCSAVGIEYSGTTNISETRRAVNSYIKQNNLLYDDKSKGVDDFLQSIAPTTLRNVVYISAYEWKSIETDIAKEIINWKASEKKAVKKERKSL